MTMTKTKTKEDYTGLTPPEQWNYWFKAILLCLLVGLEYLGNIYHTNNNSDGINAVIINGPSIVVATTTSLVCGRDSNGDGGQEDVSSTSVGDNYIKSNTNTNSFMEGGGGLLGDCDSEFCTIHFGFENSCKKYGGCFWYPHLTGYCSNCSGVSCGTHRAPECLDCPWYDSKDQGKGYCNGDCKWYHDDNGGSCVPK